MQLRTVARVGHNGNGFGVSRFRDTLQHTRTPVTQTPMRHRYGTRIHTDVCNP